MTPVAEIQEWFGNAITQPLETDHFFGVEQFIAPSDTLTANSRIKIYQEQYWWRLLKGLADDYPTLIRLFGQGNFNTDIAGPYLKAHPPTHWSLGELGRSLPAWLNDSYTGADKALVIDSAKIDLTSRHLFSIDDLPPLQPADFKSILYLQPTVKLFKLKGDLCQFRQELLQHDPVHWETCSFPQIKLGITYQVIYRESMVRWQTIHAAEYQLLIEFAKGATLENACGALNDELAKHAQEHIATWAAKWTRYQWLTPHEKPPI